MSVSYANQKVLNVLEDFCEKNIAPPTLRQIASVMGYKSPNSITTHLAILVREGLVEQTDSGGARSYYPIAYRKRVQACLEACAGISTEVLEKHGVMVKA